MSDPKEESPEKTIIKDINRNMGGVRRYLTAYTASQTVTPSDIPEAKPKNFTATKIEDNVKYIASGVNKDTINTITISALGSPERSYEIKPSFKITTDGNGYLSEESIKDVKALAAAELRQAKGRKENPSVKIPSDKSVFPTKYEVIKKDIEPDLRPPDKNKKPLNPKPTNMKNAASMIRPEDAAVLAGLDGKNGATPNIPRGSSPKTGRTV